MASRRESRDVQVRLQYFTDDSRSKPGDDNAQSFHRSATGLALGDPEIIHDVRGLEQEFDLDRNGFRYVKAPTLFENWRAGAEVDKTFIPEMEDLLRQELDDCDEIIVFDFDVSTDRHL